MNDLNDQLPMRARRAARQVVERRYRSWSLAHVLWLGLALPTLVLAQGDGNVHTGGYLGVLYGHNAVGGEFDDTVVLRGANEVIDVPRMNAGGGAGLLWGIRTSGGGGFEIGWHRSRHRTTSVLLGDSRATLSFLDFDGKWGLYREGPVRAWLLFGFGFPKLVVERSRITGAGRSDASYSGYSLNLGAGVAYYPLPRLGLTFDLLWRRTEFTSVQGEAIDEGLKGPGRALRFATTWAY
ncbi:MAG: hypothetical protein KIT17_18680 [Rubrivivax sp.]|nr:hypothetical protein [Rubrivivax sp.]